jgi:hypothetical protein
MKKKDYQKEIAVIFRKAAGDMMPDDLYMMCHSIQNITGEIMKMMKPIVEMKEVGQ